MSHRTVLIVLLALAFGIAAAVGVGRLRHGGSTEETVGVVVADQDLPRFATVTPDKVKVRQYPKSLAPAGAVKSVEEAVDRVTETRLAKDEPIMEGRLAAKGAGRGMAAAIPPGMRAVTIRTPNVATGVAGFVLPGNRVDVMFTLRTSYVPNDPKDPAGGGATMTLVQNVEILAVDQRSEPGTSAAPDAKELKSVTLLVSPEQAAQIDLAQNVGTLYLTLRNPLDTIPTAGGAATLKGIQFGTGGAGYGVGPVAHMGEKVEPPVAVAPPPTPVAPKPKKAPPPPPRVRTLRGGIPGMVVIE